MRLIDADALMKTLGIEEHCDDCQYHHHEVYCNRSCDFVTACEAISDAPTIEPKRKGMWYDVGSLSCRCSVCGCKSPKEYSYCPNCGADMREGARQDEFI